MYIHSCDDNFETSIKKILLGRKIVETVRLRNDDAIFILDNGLVLLIECEGDSANDYGDGFSYICYLNHFPYVITDIACSNIDDSEVEIRVFSEDKEVVLYSVICESYIEGCEIGHSIAVYGNVKNER